MNAYDAWRHWAIDLDDEAFARAFVALGLYASTDPAVMHAPVDRRVATWPGGAVLRWTFPATGTGHEHESPRRWAQRFDEVRQRYGEPLRIGIGRDVPGGDARRWLATFARAGVRATLVLEATRPPWPANLPVQAVSIGAPAWAALEDAAPRWPAHRLLRVARGEGDGVRGDLLVHVGHGRDLLRHLLDRDDDPKVNLVIVVGAMRDDLRTTLAQAEAIRAQTGASGVVLVDDDAPAERIGAALNDLVCELSHAMRVDDAIDAAFRKHFGDATITALTPRLAAFTLREVAARLVAQVNDAAKRGVLDDATIAQLRDLLATLPMAPGHGKRAAPIEPPRASIGFGDDARAIGDDAPGSVLESAGPPPSGADAAEAPTEAVPVDVDDVVFHSESGAASTIAEAGAVLDRARAANDARHLQQRAFVRDGATLVPADGGFVAAVPALVRVRIGAAAQGWDATPDAFPVDKLPDDELFWELTGALTEPNHLPKALVQTIVLGRAGNSTEADFVFTPGANPVFAGRVTVLYRNAVLQSATLTAGVRAAGAAPVAAPKLDRDVTVRANLTDLDGRAASDLAVIVDVGDDGSARVQAYAPDTAWVANLDAIGRIAKEINTTLSEAATSAADFVDGIEGEAGLALLIALTRHAKFLDAKLRDVLQATPAGRAIGAMTTIQVVNTGADAFVPFEFLYDYPTPRDDATLCPQWREHLAVGRCADARAHDASVVCPSGFWGLAKIIERQAATVDASGLAGRVGVQPEPRGARPTLSLGDTVVYGSSRRVTAESVDGFAAALAAIPASGARASDWATWLALVAEKAPDLLIAMPHADGRNSGVSLELGGETLSTALVDAAYVRADASRGPAIVALIGCDTTGTADGYGDHVEMFRRSGAAVVIGTIATVLGAHAATVAAALAQGLLATDRATPMRVGELLRDLKRRALAAGSIMPLALVAYGDGGWWIERGRKP